MKRIISLICIISLMCGVSLSPVSFAAINKDTVYAKEDICLEESILAQLGFVKPSAAKEMTRLELSEALAKMLSYEISDDSGENPFTDIDKTLSGYSVLKSAYDLGILSGGAARPYDTVSYNEAVKMVVCALGYGVYASYKGGYPTGYISVAYDNGILKGVEANDEKISKIAICKLLYNALHVDLLLNTGVGESLNYSTVPGKNLLLNYHNIIVDEGICYGVHGFSMLPTVMPDNGRVYIDNIILHDNASGSYDYVGYNTEYYYDADTLQLKAIAEKNSSAHTINAKDVYDYKNHILYYVDENGNEKRANLSLSTKIMFNGDIVETFSANDFLDISGEITIIENSGDNTIDTMLIRSLDALVVGGIDVGSNTVYDYYDNTPLKLDMDDSDYVVSFKDELGNRMEIKELSRGDVITYSKSKNGKIVHAVFSNTEIIGSIEAISKQNGGTLQITVDGKTYEATENFANNEVVKVGESGAFRLTTDGRIAAISFDDIAKYGYLVAGTHETGLDGKYKLKLFTQAGEMLVVDFARRVNVDGTIIDADKAYNSLKNGDTIDSQLIRYELNENGELKYIDTIKKGEYESVNSLHRSFSSEYDEYGNARTLEYAWRDTGMFGGRIPVNASGPMFVVPKDAGASDENYLITTPYKYFVHDHNYGIDAYKVLRGELIADVVVYKSDSAIQKTDENIAVVDSLTKVSHDGTEYSKLSVMSGGSLKEYLIKDNNVLKIKLRDTDSEYHTLVCGDVIKFAANDAGFITVIDLWYERETDRFKYEAYEDTSSLLESSRVAYGEVYAQISGILQFHKGPILGSDRVFGYEELECYKTGRYTIYTYDSSERHTPLRLGGVYDMIDYKTTGKGAKMVVYSRNGFDGTIVIYK